MNLIEEVECAGQAQARPQVAPYSQARENSAESRKLCVYNRTRECFLGLNVIAADLSLGDLSNLIAELALKSGEGLWIAPFQGIPETRTPVALDLIYLDGDCQVIDLHESFPTLRLTPMSAQPTSVLALPAHSIYSSQTQQGDRLLVCAAEEMEHHLKPFTDSISAAGTEPSIESEDE